MHHREENANFGGGRRDEAGHDPRADVPGLGDWGYTDGELQCKHVRQWCIEGEMIPGISTSGTLTALSLFWNDRQKGTGPRSPSAFFS